MYVKYKKYAIMGEEGDFMAYSRVKKYQELRDGLKDEAGISRERVIEDIVDDEEDDFLSFMKRNEVPEEKPIDLEDTLTEAKTFEQMRQEGSKELEQALRSAKKGVGKESQFNTRMDILSKIREPEKTTIKIDSVDEYRTDEFARGMFLNESDESVDKEVDIEEKKKMTLMERLASMSPEEDAKKAEEFLKEEKEKETKETDEKEISEIEDTTDATRIFEEDVEDNSEDINDDIEEIDDKKDKGDSKVVKFLDVIITILVILFFVLLGVIIYQSFF